MSKTVDDGKACAVLSYLLVGIVWFFADKKMKKNTYAKFHVKQSIIFFILLIIVNIGVSLVSLLSKPFGEIVGYIVYAVMFLLWVIAVIFALSGDEKELPVFGRFARVFEF
ncbi:MAG: hypothetical protein ACP5N3_05205 [Candidatus Nanoarchaeia archaeon]